MGRSLLLTDRPDADHVTLEMVCGKGGYVRSVARDLGQALGCHGHVKSLRRTWSGPFKAADGLSMEQVEELAQTPELDSHIQPLEIGLYDLPEVKCTAEGAAKLRNGNPGMVLAATCEYGDTCWASYDGQAVAVGVYKAGEIHPTRVFQNMITRTHTKGDAPSTAVYSDCERYRYSLTRVWDDTGGKVLFVMLNPSTATEVQNDPTVERCERRARTLGFGAFQVTNIFAWRDTDPRGMRAAKEPVGAANDATITAGAAWADQVIAAWGTHGAHLDRGAQVEALLRGTGQTLYHLGLSKAGHPKHPLYIAYTQQPEVWNAQ